MAKKPEENQKVPEIEPSPEMKQLKEEKDYLQYQLNTFSEMINLKEEGFYRRQLLQLLERIAVALEDSLNEKEEAEEDDTTKEV